MGSMQRLNPHQEVTSAVVKDRFGGLGSEIFTHSKSRSAEKKRAKSSKHRKPLSAKESVKIEKRLKKLQSMREKLKSNDSKKNLTSASNKSGPLSSKLVKSPAQVESKNTNSKSILNSKKENQNSSKERPGGKSRQSKEFRKDNSSQAGNGAKIVQEHARSDSSDTVIIGEPRDHHRKAKDDSLGSSEVRVEALKFDSRNLKIVSKVRSAKERKSKRLGRVSAIFKKKF